MPALQINDGESNGKKCSLPSNPRSRLLIISSVSVILACTLFVAYNLLSSASHIQHICGCVEKSPTDWQIQDDQLAFQNRSGAFSIRYEFVSSQGLSLYYAFKTGNVGDLQVVARSIYTNEIQTLPVTVEPLGKLADVTVGMIFVQTGNISKQSIQLQVTLPAQTEASQTLTPFEQMHQISTAIPQWASLRTHHYSNATIPHIAGTPTATLYDKVIPEISAGHLFIGLDHMVYGYFASENAPGQIYFRSDPHMGQGTMINEDEYTKKFASRIALA